MPFKTIFKVLKLYNRRYSLSNSPCPLGRAQGRSRYNLLARAIKNKPFQCSDGCDSPQWRCTAARVEQADLSKFYSTDHFVTVLTDFHLKCNLKGLLPQANLLGWLGTCWTLLTAGGNNQDFWTWQNLGKTWLWIQPAWAAPSLQEQSKSTLINPCWAWCFEALAAPKNFKTPISVVLLQLRTQIFEQRGNRMMDKFHWASRWSTKSIIFFPVLSLVMVWDQSLQFQANFQPPWCWFENTWKKGFWIVQV